jgi:hypothetical protein
MSPSNRAKADSRAASGSSELVVAIHVRHVHVHHVLRTLPRPPALLSTAATARHMLTRRFSSPRLPGMGWFALACKSGSHANRC